MNKDKDKDSLQWRKNNILKMQLFLNNALPLLLEEIDNDLVNDIKEGYYLINEYLNQVMIAIKKGL